MKLLFIVLVVVQAIWFVWTSSRSRSDHIFQPFPGYTLLFSLYFLFGTLALSEPASDEQWAAYILGALGFGALAQSFISRIFTQTYVRLPSRQRADQAEGASHFFVSFNGYLLLVLWLSSLAIVGALWAQNGIPLFSGNVDQARMAVAANGYLGTLGTSIDVTALFAVVFIFSSRGQRKDWRFWLSLAVILSFVMVALLSGSRSRIFKLIIPAATAFHFTRRRIPISWVLYGLPGGFMVIGMLGYFRAYSRWGGYVLQGIPATVGHDIFSLIVYYASIELSTAVQGFAIVLKTFPMMAPFTHGWLHIGPLVTPLQIKVPIPGNYFKALIGGTWDGVGLAATFLAPGYAEFGLAGVLGFSALYGLGLGILYRRCTVNGQNRYYRIATYSLMYYFMLSAIRSDFVSFDVIWFMLLSYAFRVLRLRRRAQPVDAF